MNYLFLDTASSRVIISVIRNNEIVFTVNLKNDNNLSNKLMVLIDENFKKYNLKPTDINKIFVQSGERHGSINKIIAIAKENKVVVTEVEKSKLDFMSKTKNHQGVIAVVPPFNYCEVEDILEYVKD